MIKIIINKIVYFWSKILKKLRGAAIKNSTVHNTSKIESGTSFYNSSMEKHSFCGYDCDISYTKIGKFCSIANGVVIGGGRHPIEWVSTSPVFYEGKDSVTSKFSEHKRTKIKTTIICNDVWIGQNVLIKQGIKIGNGSVIGMGSVVTKDVEPYSIVAGVPAKKIRMRFPENIIKSLLKIKWWDMDESNLRDFAKDFNNLEKFLKNYK